MTPYETVFKAFLSKVQEPLFAEIEIDVALDDLIGIMDGAILNFEYPKIDLKDKDDINQQFNNTLGFDEIQLLANLMVLEWVKRELRNVDSLRQFMTTKDFNTFSQANHINALVNAERMMRKDVKSLKIQYSIRNGNKSQFFVLGGDGQQ